MLTDSLFHSLRGFPQLQRQLKRLLLHLPSRCRTIEHRRQHLVVDPTELSGYYLYYERVYDPEVFNFLEKVIHRYARVLDIGANIGVYTVFFGARVSRVDAFEPMPEVVARLKKNVKLNTLANVVIHEVCVGLEKGTVQVTLPTQTNSGLGRIALQAGDLSRPSICLDDFLAGSVTEATLIKMDIEGAEWMALAGAKSILRNRKSQFAILLETHPAEIEEYGGSIQALYKLLVDSGLRVQTISEAGLVEFSPDESPRFWWVSAS